jgi:hypothetical protein
MNLGVRSLVSSRTFFDGTLALRVCVCSDVETIREKQFADEQALAETIAAEQVCWLKGHI